MRFVVIAVLCLVLAGCQSKGLKVVYTKGDISLLVESDREYAEGYELEYTDPDTGKVFRFAPKSVENRSSIVAEKALDIVDRKLPDLNTDG